MWWFVGVTSDLYGCPHLSNMSECDDDSLWNGYSYLPRDTSFVMKYIFSFYWALGMLTGTYHSLLTTYYEAAYYSAATFYWTLGLLTGTYYLLHLQA